eukprot:CAMPEP_0172453110 /NCGR_PEP_ID=MMETSP1065-20121228/10570_1 /TAXON_ID=265537 /ORGANISM="Amphiprora paludosa, Strain CCMP125" /LENGTH=215 /DNA_ID=CAMNT_0013205279 /DNA_START=85 /DNA_END=732 /DNA_ORIENTATION=-
MRASSISLIVANDDDCSVSSTFDVSTVKQEQQAPLHTTRPRRSVRFAMFDTQAYDNTQMYKEDCRDLWYTSADYKSFKANNTNNAKDIIRMDLERRQDPKAFPNVMNRIYDACCSAAMNNNNNISDIDSQDANCLADWLSVSYGRIGLERMCVRAIRNDKFPRRHELVDTVLEIQQEMMGHDEDQKAQFMALAAQQITRPSRLFAVHLARASSQS